MWPFGTLSFVFSSSFLFLFSFISFPFLSPLHFPFHLHSPTFHFLPDPFPAFFSIPACVLAWTTPFASVFFLSSQSASTRATSKRSQHANQRQRNGTLFSPAQFALPTPRDCSRLLELFPGVMDRTAEQHSVLIPRTCSSFPFPFPAACPCPLRPLRVFHAIPTLSHPTQRSTFFLLLPSSAIPSDQVISVDLGIKSKGCSSIASSHHSMCVTQHVRKVRSSVRSCRSLRDWGTQCPD